MYSGDSGGGWRLRRVPALDGLRGFAVLLVLAGHAHVAALEAAGGVGVTVFFALSGFLITALLLEERTTLAGFYARRARRLLPALGLFLGVMTLAWSVAGVLGLWWRPLLATVLYVNNVWRYTSGGPYGPLGHMWSLSVEEQFYLVWPVVVLLARSRRWLAGLAGCAVVGALVERLLMVHAGVDPVRIYFGTDTHLDAIAAGCLLSIALYGRELRWRVPGWAGWAALVVIAGFSAFPLWGRVDLAVTPEVVAGLTVVALLAALTGWASLGWAPLAWLGRISYGVYLWHYPLIWFIAPGMPLPLPAAEAVALGLTLSIAAASYRWVELPIRQVRAGPRTAEPRSSEAARASAS